MSSPNDDCSSPGCSSRKRNCFLRLAVCIVAIHSLLLFWGGSLQSPTLNEPAHLVAGLADWQLGRFDLYKVNPPLVRMIATIPVLLAGYQEDWRHLPDQPVSRPEFLVDADFVAVNGERSVWLFVIARWACIPFSILGAVICYCWANELYGSAAAIVAVGLWCFCPNLIGHGQLITADVPAAALGVSATYCYWRWVKRPTWGRAVFSGLMLGLAELSKMTLIVFVPLWPTLWIIYRLSSKPRFSLRAFFRELGMLCVQLLITLYLINVGYGFDETGTRLRDFHFLNSNFVEQDNLGRAVGNNRFTKDWIGMAPIPVPKDYLLGIDLQKQDIEQSGRLSYLRGRFSSHGWWYYYLYALAIKVPLGTLLLLLLSVLARLFAKLPVQRKDEAFLLLPAIAVIILVSSQTSLNEHMRYVLPAFPYAFIWIGRVTCVNVRLHPIFVGITSIALSCSIMSSLWVYPHDLSYFNELVGGPRGGPTHLIDSNIDWGQDLLFLKRWMQNHPEAQPLRLAYFGYYNPKEIGINYIKPETASINARSVSNIPPGWYAISANLLRGLPWTIYDSDGSQSFWPQGSFSRFQELNPVAMAGYSIYIYHVE
jgi:4-amino-4-deoxy-L-arabinose transferase-like glycosyltransferase